MNKHLLITALCFLFGMRGANAQALRIAYWGETLTHYGVRIGLEHPIAHAQRTTSSSSLVQNDLYVGLYIGVYRHPQNHVGATLSPELGWRRTGKRGGVVQAALSTGLIRTFYEATTYKTRPDGTFERLPVGGQWGFLPGVSVGFGHDFSVRTEKPIVLFANVHYTRQYPYNRSFLHKPFFELGIIKK